jgi:hypothetical protein
MRAGLIALAVAAVLIFVLSGFTRHFSAASGSKSAMKAESARYETIPAYQQQVRRYLNDDPS